MFYSSTTLCAAGETCLFSMPYRSSQKHSETVPPMLLLTTANRPTMSSRMPAPPYNAFTNVRMVAARSAVPDSNPDCCSARMAVGRSKRNSFCKVAMSSLLVLIFFNFFSSLSFSKSFNLSTSWILANLCLPSSISCFVMLDVLDWPWVENLFLESFLDMLRLLGVLGVSV